MRSALAVLCPPSIALLPLSICTHSHEVGYCSTPVRELLASWLPCSAGRYHRLPPFASSVIVLLPETTSLLCVLALPFLIFCSLCRRRRTASLLRRLQMIWISHSHADHHLGLPRILCAANSVRLPGAAPIIVVGPRVIGRWLETYHALLPLSSRPLYAFECCAAFNGARSSRRATVPTSMLARI